MELLGSLIHYDWFAYKKKPVEHRRYRGDLPGEGHVECESRQTGVSVHELLKVDKQTSEADREARTDSPSQHRGCLSADTRILDAGFWS